MAYRHTPVLPAEVLQHLNPHTGGIYVDCTLGGAGHARRIAEAFGPDGLLVGIDRDAVALTAASEALRLGRQSVLLKGDFGDLDDLLEEAGVPYVDGILFDLGVSSPQLDVAERGFSYQDDAPLDMRMDASAGITAADVVNTYGERELARILAEYGEERWATRIAAFITAARARRPIQTTGELVEIIKNAIPASARRAGGHPAKRTFQALRIEVNGELDSLERGLRAAVKWLAPGGRVVVISYHSLEDRLVKRVFEEFATGCTCPPDLPKCVCGAVPMLRVLTRKAVLPSATEVEENPRSRSAKLRAAERV